MNANRVCISVLLLILACTSYIGISKANNYTPEEPSVATLAGDGRLGIRDGPHEKAEFIQPGGIAVGPDSTVYVTDLAAHTIRAIHGGTVKTLAGFAPPGPFRTQRIGGYKDGPAQSARFNRPSGIAVDKDGTIYIADELNHCIRKIQKGIVTTFAGSPTNGMEDGTGPKAGFLLPRGLSIDDDGNLYVADFGRGVRKVTPDGVISTLDVTNDGGVYGIATKGSQQHLILAYVDRKAIHLVNNRKHREAVFDQEREPYSQGFRIGHAFGITILGYNTVAVTDDMNNAIRFVRFPSDGIPSSMTRALAGGIREGTLDIGGYRDGPTSEALVDVPYGIASTRTGELVVSDSGNRRIRIVRNLNPRTPDWSDPNRVSPGPASYRIALIGSSYNFMNVLWPESFAGAIENGLAKDRSRIGLAKRPWANIVRLDGGNFSDEQSYIENYFGDGEVDLVVWFISVWDLKHELLQQPSLKEHDAWKSVIPIAIQRLDSRLRQQQTKLLLVIIPQGEQVSPLERAHGIEAQGADDYDVAKLYGMAKEFEDFITSSQVPTFGLLAPMERFEEQPTRFPLYYPYDFHLSPQGTTWVSKTLLKVLEKWKPWETGSIAVPSVL